MVTSLSYSMTCNGDEYVAKCEELPVQGGGRSSLDAIWALRMAIEQRVTDWYTLERHLPEQQVRPSFEAAYRAPPAPGAHA